MGVNHTVSTPTSAQQRMLAAALAFVLTVIGLGQAALPAHAEQEVEATSGVLAQIAASRTVLDGRNPKATIYVVCTPGETVHLYQDRPEVEGGPRGYGNFSVQCTGAQQVLAADVRVTEPVGSMSFFAAHPTINFGYERLTPNLTITWDPWVISGMHFGPTSNSGGQIAVQLNKPLTDTDTRLNVYLKRPSWSAPLLQFSCNEGNSCLTKTTTWSSHTDPANIWTYTLSSSQGTTPHRALGAYQQPVTPAVAETCGGPCGDSNQLVGTKADPISTLDGTYFETFTDLSMSSRGPTLEFARTYTSGRADQDGPLGYGWAHPYGWSVTRSPDGLSATVKDGRGNETVFTKEGTRWVGPSHVRQRLTESAGAFDLYRIDSRLTLSFNPDGTLSSLADHNGETLEMGYTSGRLTSISGQSTQQINLGWTGSRITSVTDHTGRSVSYAYDPSGNLTDTSLPEGMSWTYTYDGAHRLLSKKDARNATTTNTYGSTGRISSQTNPLGGETFFAYSISGDKVTTTVTDPDGTRERHFYAQRSLMAVTERLGTPNELVTSYFHDPITLQTTLIARGERETSLTYDERGNLTAHAVEHGPSSVFAYNSEDLLIAATDALGFQTTFEYDAHGNLVQTASPGSDGQSLVTTLGRSTSHPGEVTSVTTPTGTASIIYDGFGNPLQQTDRTGRRTAMSADSLGRVLKVTSEAGVATPADPDDHAVRMAYDDAGRVETSTDALSGVSEVSYDASGNPVLVEDPAGNQTVTTFDLLGNVTSTTTGTKTTFTSFDGAGRTVTQVDGKGKATTYAYGTDGLLLSITDPLGRSTTYAHNKYGEPTRITEVDGDVTALTYDSLGRVTKKVVTTASGSGRTGGTTTWAYDELGRVSSMTDVGGTTDYAYDPASRLLSVDAPGTDADISYAYDLSGRQTSLTYPGDKVVTRAFDAEGRVTKVTDWSAREHSFVYDANGAPSSHLLPGGMVETAIGRDALSRPTTLITTAGGAEVGRFTYAYDARSQLSSIATSGAVAWNDGGQSLGFDPSGRLTANGQGSTVWDEANQITALPQQSARVFDDAGQVTSASLNGVATTFAHSATGARTSQTDSSGVTSYGYDGEDHLSTFTKAGLTATYTYDGNGLRRSKQVNAGASETFGWDVSAGLPLLTSDASNSYIYGPRGELIQQVAKSTDAAVYPTHDITGSVRLLLDSSGTVVGKKVYTGWGKVFANGVSTPFGFAGEYTDQESGLIYLRARYYDPATALFLTVDPLVSITRDRYGYADGDPYLKGDPSGQIPLLAAVAIGGAIIGGTSAFLTAIQEDASVEDALKMVVIGAAGGAASGVCYGMSLGAGALCGGLINGATSAITDVALGHAVNKDTLLVSSITGAVAGMIPTPKLDVTSNGINGLARVTAGWKTSLNARLLGPRNINAIDSSGIEGEVLGNHIFSALSTIGVPTGIHLSADYSSRKC